MNPIYLSVSITILLSIDCWAQLSVSSIVESDSRELLIDQNLLQLKENLY
jgi:hypothetical protein